MMDDVKSLVWSNEVQSAVRVDGWPNPERLMKTIMVHTNAFLGVIVFEATLSPNPQEDDWFEFKTETFERPSGIETRHRIRIINDKNRFVWMRAKVNTVSGTVDRILIM